MRIGISLGGIPAGDDVFERIKASGFDCIDYDTIANTAKHPAYALNDADFEKFFLSERDRIRAAGLEVSQTHGAWRYPAYDGTEDERAERFEKMSRGIWATKLLDCKYFIIHPLMPFGAESDENPQGVWDINLEFMTRLAKVGEEHGVIVCLENMPMLKFPMSKPDIVLKMVKEINSPWLRMCLDTGHCVVHEGWQAGQAVRLIGKEYLATLHVHDNNGKNDLHWLPFSGGGMVDWEDFRKAIFEIGYDGVMSIETSITDTTKLPKELLEYEEKGLARVARYLASKPE